jgi:hypothetical protein
LAGKTVDVLSQGGVYRPATFKSHGFQQLWEVHTGQGTIYATKEHEWPVKTWSKQPSGVTSSSIVKRTTDRLAGKSVPRVVADRPPQNDLFWEGVRHGIVFGDGTLSNEGKQAHVILYTAEKRYLARYFEGYATITPHHEDKYLGVYGQSPAYKQLPESSSASYWYGFTCGLLSTDGSVDNRGQVILTQKDPNVLCAISERLPWLGLCGGQVREHWAWNSFTKQQEPMNYLSLFTQFMREQDFIRPDQKQRFLSCFVPTEYGKCVKVKKVVSTNRVEEVFCCVEPETHTFAIEDGVLTGNCYGNSLVSIFYPFVKMLRCTRCGFEKQASDAIYRFMNFEFHWQCEQCDHAGIAKVRDHYIKAPKGIRLLRWNPEDIDIRYNDICGEYEYYYSIPVQLKNDIIIGKKSAVESVPQLFIDALRLRKAVVFSRDNIYHFKRPTLAGKDRGWGTPLILPVLKDTFYLQVLRKAQEAIALEHIVPLRMLFPQAGSATSDPYTTVNLQDWHDQIAGELRRWRCVTPDSFVETINGLQRAGDVGVGDQLKNRYGIFETVTKRHERQMDDGESAYRLKVRGQHAIDTVYSEEHPIWAAKKINNGNGHKLGSADFIPVSELTPGDYVGYPTVRLINEVEKLDLAEYVDRAVTEEWVYIDHTDIDVPAIFEYLSAHGEVSSRNELLEEHGWGLNSYKCAQAAIREGRTLRRVPRYLNLDQELAWVLGLYAAEGNTTVKGVFFSLHKDETAFVDKLDRFFASRFGASKTGGEKSENGIQIAYPSIVAAQFFHSLIPGTAINKRLPDVIRHATDDIAVAAVNGVLDGDGSYYEDKTVLGVSSRQLAEDTRQLMLSWQVMPGISFVEGQDVTICGKKTKGHGCYLVQVSGDSHKQLSAILAGETYSGSTFSRIGLFREGFAWFRIEEVAKVEADTVVAFQMDGDSTFCTWGVATHNSDNNYIPILPLPIGQETIGGDGRALLLSQEIRVWSEHIVAGMGVPNELIFGGLSYSGSNVSLRMLENMFLGYLSDQLSLLRWVIDRTASYLSWPKVGARFKPFKMADDLQRKAYLFQLNQAGKMSDESLMADADYDSAKEDKIMEMEGEAMLVTAKWQNKAQAKAMVEQAAIQTEAAKEQMAFQSEMQNGMMQDQAAAQTGQPAPQKSPDLTPTPRNPALISPPKEISSPLTMSSIQQHPASATNSDIAGGMNVDLLYVARQLADRISRLTPAEKPVTLRRLQERSPELHDTVVGLMMSGANGPTAASAASARALPKQRPPQRGPEAAMV